MNKVLSFHGEKKESSFLVFSGSGGFGKSAFLTELSKGLSTSNVAYNFSNGNELVTVLRELRTMLSNKYGMLFPLFDKGYVYYRQKCGNISSTQIRDFLDVKSNLGRAITHTNKLIGRAYDLNNFLRTIETVVEDAGLIAKFRKMSA